MNERVYTEHQDAVRAFARKLAGNSADADDLVSETFEALPRALQQYENRSELRSFLLGVCANVWRRMQRAYFRREQVHGAFETEAPVATPDFESRIAAGQLAGHLAKALDGLPEAQRTAFMLVAVEERQVREVANLCGVPEATIRSRVFHARRKLQETLAAPERSGYHALLAGALVALVIISGCAGLVASPLGRPLRLWLGEVIEVYRKGARTSPPRTFAPTPKLQEGPPLGNAPSIPLEGDGVSASSPQPGAPPTQSSNPRGGVSAGSTERDAAPEHGLSSRQEAPTVREKPPGASSPAENASPPSPPAEAPSAPLPAWDLSVDAYSKAHRLHVEEHRYAEASLAWDAYLRDFPNGSLARDARFNRALTFVQAGRYAEARDALAPFAEGKEDGFKQEDARVLLQALDSRR